MRCKVCGKKMKLKKKDRYEVTKNMFPRVSEKNTYEAFDCKKCGCQNLVNIRETGKSEEKAEEKKHDKKTQEADIR